MGLHAGNVSEKMKLSITLAVAEEAATFALELANTKDPMRRPPDLLASSDDAAAFLGPYLTEEEDPARIADDLIPFRDSLRSAFKDGTNRSNAPSAAEERLTAALAPRWHITNDDLWGTVICMAPEGPSEQRLAAWAALGYFALRRGVPDRLKVCESAPCEEIFRDGTKSGKQRFCSKRCANRFNVARHRSRQRA